MLTERQTVLGPASDIKMRYDIHSHPTLLGTGERDEPCSRGPWGGASRATPQPTRSDVARGRACQQPVRSGAHGVGDIRAVPWISLRFIQATFAEIRHLYEIGLHWFRAAPGAMNRAPTFFLIGLIVLLVFRPTENAGAENIKIGIPSLSVTTMPLAVAGDQGFFQKEGLHVDVVMMPASLNIKVLLSGEIQYATTVGSAVVAAVRGINTRVVMCFVDRPLLDLVATPDIHSISDLKGKLLGISSRGGLHDVSMRAILTQSGIDPAQTTLLTVGTQGSMYAALKTGRISAGLLNPPQNFLAYRDGLKNLAFAGNYIRLPSTGLVTLKETLDRSPDQVRRVIRALARARVFARENRAATVGILKRFLRMDDEDLAAKIYDYHKRAETPDGKIDGALAAETIRDTRQAEGITRDIPVNQVFDFGYLDSAN